MPSEGRQLAQALAWSCAAFALATAAAWWCPRALGGGPFRDAVTCSATGDCAIPDRVPGRLDLDDDGQFHDSWRFLLFNPGLWFGLAFAAKRRRFLPSLLMPPLLLAGACLIASFLSDLWGLRAAAFPGVLFGAGVVYAPVGALLLMLLRALDAQARRRGLYAQILSP